MNRRTPFVLSALLVALIATAMAAGCSQAPSSGAEQTPISAMKPDDKRSLVATSFPLEVPVPVGEITRAKAQGDDAWDYTVLVTATPQALLDWYRTVYTAAQWTATAEGDFDGGDGTGRFIEFRKGNSQSSVYVEGTQDDSGRSTARVVLGVGTPVLETQ